MQLNPYLIFNGNCEEALQFYERVLGAKVDCLLRHEATPAEQNIPHEWRKKVMHARFTINGQPVMASDCPPQHYQPPQGFSVTLGIEDPAEADRVFAALAEQGNVRMPIAETFWARRFGMLVDRFGIPWMVNCAKAQPEFSSAAA